MAMLMFSFSLAVWRKPETAKVYEKQESVEHNLDEKKKLGAKKKKRFLSWRNNRSENRLDFKIQPTKKGSSYLNSRTGLMRSIGCLG